MRRKIAVIFTFLLLLVSFLTISTVRANLSLIPGKLTITMPEGYPKEDIEYRKIYVENHYDYDINIVTQVTNPSYDDIKEGYTLIPDLSWVEVSPEVINIPANSNGYFTLKISVPENEQASHLDEKWEVRVLVYKKSASAPGTASINIKLASRIFIHTPPSAAAQLSIHPFIYVILAVFIGLIGLGTATSYTKKKKFIQANRPAVFYVRKSKSRNHDKKKF